MVRAPSGRPWTKDDHRQGTLQDLRDEARPRHEGADASRRGGRPPRARARRPPARRAEGPDRRDPGADRVGAEEPAHGDRGPPGPDAGGPRPLPAPRLRPREGGGKAGDRPAPLRRPAPGRRRPPPGEDLGDANGRGEDPRRHAPRHAERPRRPRRPRRDRQRLPRTSRRRVDGTDLRHPGPERRLHPARPRRRRSARGLRLRHHLRHEQRVRLRLPARQHEVRAHADGPAPPFLRPRRRGRLHPHRRGPDPPHHLRALRGRCRHLLPVRPDRPEARPGRGAEGQVREQDDDRRLPRRREGPHRRPDGGGSLQVRAAPRRRESLRPDEHRRPPRLPAGPPGSHPLQARRELRREGGAGHHRRRVHGPPHAGPPVVGRPPPGRRGAGRRQDRAREPDARHRHAPELLPDVRQAGGHDGNGRHRGGGVRQDLQARRRRRPDEPRHDPKGRARRRLPDGAREVRRRRRGDRRAAREEAARPRRDDLDREVRAPRAAPEEARCAPRRPERQVPRAGGGHRRPGGPAGPGHDRHEHGGPRHRHPPRREPGVPREAEEQGEDGRGVPEAPRGGGRRVRRRPRGGHRRRRPPHHRYRAPRIAPDRQPASRPRRPSGRPGLLALLPLPRGRPDADLRVRPALGADEAARDGGGRPDRAPLGDEVDRARPEAGRGEELRHPQAPPRVRRRHEQAARGDLPAPQGDPHRRAVARLRRRPGRGRRRRLRRPPLPGREGPVGVELAGPLLRPRRVLRSLARGRRPVPRARQQRRPQGEAEDVPEGLLRREDGEARRRRHEGLREVLHAPDRRRATASGTRSSSTRGSRSSSSRR